MKNSLKNNILSLVLAAFLPLAAMSASAADSPEGKGKGPSAEERKARMEQCKANPEKCRAEREARQAKWCADNPERCKEMKARREKRAAECKANPERCKQMQEQMKEKMEKRGTDKKAHFEERFKRADTDGNGAISRAEAEANMPRLARHFDRVDANKDGQITIDEIAAVRKARFERRHQGAERTKI